MKSKILIIFLFVGALCFYTAIPANAYSLGFYNITGNNLGDAAIGEAQLSVEVTDAEGDKVLFTFSNSGPEASSICDVYFDDGFSASLLNIDWIDNSVDGVAFTRLAKPGNLPGANDATPPFITTAGLSADSDSPTQPNGVNPGETLWIYFNLINGQEFADVLSDLGTGDLRIGIHVQGFDTGGSESFVNTIPEPSTMLLLGFGLVGLAAVGRKRFH